ncbi:zinc phosphodiesterase ELAC protein 1-like isoform X1 [Macrobrachium rosenbergii]|uniref:zinc phosphodiesterase ELAC protein 1-like isoform X1 n=1 Tax=Macrobrachium rosenbergii TaxID=79674 RepID=UPI0034D5AAA9
MWKSSRMKIYFLGTGSSYPSTRRGVSAAALQLDDGNVWLFDCGEGTQIQVQKVAFSRQKINKIFITHLHGDHLFGLPGLLCTISSQIGLSEEELQKKGAPVVDLYGPQGLRRFVYTALSLSRSLLLFKYRVHELVPIKEQYLEDWDQWVVDHSAPSVTHPSELPGSLIYSVEDSDGNAHWKLFDDDNWCAVAGWIHHRVPSFGFVLNQKGRPGTLDKEKLLELGLPPGPLYGQLKKGKAVTTEDGKLITPDMVVGSLIPGKSLVILGDTRDASPLAHLVRGCDVLIHEATYDNSLKEKAAENGHSTSGQAAEFAKRINAKVLLLNHFSQRYGQVTEDSQDEETVAVLEQEALLALEGMSIQVKCAEDLFTYELPITSRGVSK